jgi:hypothetical protein
MTGASMPQLRGSGTMDRPVKPDDYHLGRREQLQGQAGG